MKRFLSILLAAVMFVSLFATVAFADGESLEDIIDEKIDMLVCGTHGKLDLVFGTSGTICPENLDGTEPGTRSLEIVLSEIFGYPATIDDEELLYVRDDYGKLGHGQTAWPDEITVTFTDPASGEEYDADIELSLYKDLAGKHSGAIGDKGYFGVCGEDWPADGKAGLKAIAGNPGGLFGNPELLDDKTVIEIPGDEFTKAAVESWFRGRTNLGDAWTFYCSDLDASKAVTGQEVNVALVNHNVNGEGRTASVSCAPTLKIKSLEDRIDEKYDELVCGAHGKLDLVFGSSGTITTDTLGAILTELFGYTATVDQDGIDFIKGKYQGLGGGLTAWCDAVEVTFSNPETGEEYETEMDLSVFKSLYGQHSGALNEEHPTYYGTCPDDWPAEAKAAMAKVDPWDETQEFEIPGKVYTPEAVEAWYREQTGLGEGWTFYYNWYDAAKAYTGNEIAIALMNNDVNGEGRTMIVACGPKLHIAQSDSLQKDIDSAYEALVCEAHSKLDLVFGTSGTLDSLNDVLTGIFEYTAVVDPDDIARMKEQDAFGGLGNGKDSYAWVDDVTVTFTNPVTFETYERKMDLSLFKAVSGYYAGALNDEHPGYFGICPDDLEANEKNATKLDDWNEDTVVEISGEEYTLELVENWFRREAKLVDGWTFFCNWFNAEDAAGEGNEIALALMNNDIYGTKRTMIVSCTPKLRFTKVEPVKFVDVADGAYYADAVAWAVKNGITNGMDKTHFAPDAGCTRGQVVTFLWRAAGEPEPSIVRNPFKDVAKKDYFYKAVLWAVEKGITKGTDAAHFSPNDTCTRGQIVTFLYRWKGE
ncbi:MAG: S-layer homology domain-containing protein, partial [Clostridia bacterium]|nr:S-layer homology domain-containing protein [Clostridia bacterium]